MIYGKVPPQARDLEGAILGAIMLEKGAYDLVEDILKPESFYVDANQRIFSAFKAMKSASIRIDQMTTIQQLMKVGDLEMVGGMYYLTTLTKEVVSSAHIEDHARIVQEKFIKREVIRECGNLIASAYEDETDAFQLVDEAEAKIYAISAGNIRHQATPTPQIVVEQLDHLAHLMNNKMDLTGVPSGFRLLDSITNGWQQPDLIIIAARPSVGKTAFALNLAMNAINHPYKSTGVGFFSLEMSKGQLMNRLLSSESNIDLEKIGRGRTNADEYQIVTNAGSRIADMNLHIDDSPSLNILELRSKARKLVSKYKIGLIIIDYLQLMSGVEKGGKGMLREQEISHISRSLKQLAKELCIPVIALSQLSREVEKRAVEGTTVKHKLSDLRESGAIEQDADIVAFLARPEYGKTTADQNNVLKYDGEMQIKKHRNGTLEDIAFKVRLNIQKWMDVEDFEQSFVPQLQYGQYRVVTESEKLQNKDPNAPKQLPQKDPTITDLSQFDEGFNQDQLF